MERVRVFFAIVPLILAACGGAAEEAGEVPPTVAEDVKSTVVERIQAYNDTIPIAHPETGERVELVFDHVHEEVAATPGGRYVACVDFLDPDGTVWDVDYYVGEQDGGYAVEDVLIHTIDDENVIPEGTRRRLETNR